MQAQSSKAYLDRTQTKIAVHVIKCRRFSCESLWSWALLAGMQAYFAHFAVPSIWTFKLTESWGESKNDSKGEIACPTSMFLWVAFFFFLTPGPSILSLYLITWYIFPPKRLQFQGVIGQWRPDMAYALLSFPTPSTRISYRVRFSRDFSRLPRVGSLLVGYGLAPVCTTDETKLWLLTEVKLRLQSKLAMVHSALKIPRSEDLFIWSEP